MNLLRPVADRLMYLNGLNSTLRPESSAERVLPCLQALDKRGRLAAMREDGHNMLREMLEMRTKAHDHMAQFPATQPLPPPPRAANGTAAIAATAADGPKEYTEEEFPSHVIAAMLERERLLTSAKLHNLKHSYDQHNMQVRCKAVPRSTYWTPSPLSALHASCGRTLHTSRSCLRALTY
jgi:hypothetical protein